MKFTPVFIAAVALAAVCCLAADDPLKPELFCSDGKEYTFDLTSLHHAAGQPDTITGIERSTDPDYDDMTYYFNIGGDVTSGEGGCSGASVCQRANGGMKGSGAPYDFKSCGQSSTQEFSCNNQSEAGKGVIAKYSGGKNQRSTTIYLDCDEKATTPSVGEITESGTTYSVHIKTKAACGSKGGSSGSSDTAAIVILVLLLVGIVAYFGIGAFYQIKVKGASTPREYIIHNEFWCSLPSLVKDGVSFILHGCKKGDYISV